MAKIELQFGELGGGLNIDLTNMVQNSATDKFPATIGKKYLVITTHGGGGGNVSSGGTVESSFNHTQYSNMYIYTAIIKATATTVVMTGSGNNVNYVQLD